MLLLTVVVVVFIRFVYVPISPFPMFLSVKRNIFVLVFWLVVGPSVKLFGHVFSPYPGWHIAIQTVVCLP